MAKKIGYLIFAVFFSFYRLFPLNKKKVFFVATHDESDEGNAGIVAKAIASRMPDKKIVFLTKRDGIQRPFSFFFGKSYHLATAGTIFLDNVFMPMAYTPISKKAKVVQLWHGTGSIKKFGLDSDRGEVARLAAKADGRITHLIVNSELTKRQYMSAFAVPEERVYVIGLPRTDLILNAGKIEEKKKNFYKKYTELVGRRCILYAPTFRDSEVEHPKLALDLDSIHQKMEKNDVLLLRLHPHVAANFDDTALEKYKNRIVNMSSYRGTTTLLAVSDMLITDYSSIVFEYCLFQKPMLFYAYDLEDFAYRGRDFYEPYETYVPGPIVKKQDELEEYLTGTFEYMEKIERFTRENYKYLDENAVNRLFELIF